MQGITVDAQTEKNQMVRFGEMTPFEMLKSKSSEAPVTSTFDFETYLLAQSKLALTYKTTVSHIVLLKMSTEQYRAFDGVERPLGAQLRQGVTRILRKSDVKINPASRGLDFVKYHTFLIVI